MAKPFDLRDFVLSSPRETDSFGHTIGRVLQGGDVLALLGELGAGKTALVRGIVAGLGGSVASVTSPTFALVHEYQGRLPLIHLDLYRLKRVDEAESIGLSACFTDEAVTAIEWADRFPDLLPVDRLEMRLIHRTRTTRMVQLEAQGARSRSLLMRIHKACHARSLSARLPRSRTRLRRKASQR
ncbi:MAG: tRNA (adenosine(37)-N6)-threonylcarbamoyltransferase complex ATPase subunit type 1 TsaE [Nitrospira sp.]|nr:tRNA (adenosine(37)-N6)-threonylcarbamoyltransferase complex ATPase subunit type 1 TsaE [Nitrospira sp.]MDH4368823.1 tRNA (adenosine(37)-N6)-threonylcarbamoyltransferase complex ATPase subunit type 1 TsaE [Nitrospira sp.]MDH5348798.1 tRNA (adenosine(37)-N6)-threonylcarbamoyltransferase complex ATPase subunit type 1 TsaE [Nitrospira sp.]MDH5495951.1 tRNA (adenosine(37)-N6)-threonylcarbamoyltransferase complex ATPase subunit type 1 TsaE [Nitrospira sp.]MDH5724877.1 tRNA (adenosine(37)-N6)-thre